MRQIIINNNQNNFFSRSNYITCVYIKHGVKVLVLVNNQIDKKILALSTVTFSHKYAMNSPFLI